MTEEQCQLVSGGYQEWPYTFTSEGWQDFAQYFYCTLVNQTYIEVSNS